MSRYIENAVENQQITVWLYMPHRLESWNWWILVRGHDMAFPICPTDLGTNAIAWARILI